MAITSFTPPPNVVYARSMFTFAAASSRASSPSVPRPVVGVDHQHLALVGDTHVALLQRRARARLRLIGHEHVDHAAALAGERRQAGDVHARLAQDSGPAGPAPRAGRRGSA